MKPRKAGGGNRHEGVALGAFFVVSGEVLEARRVVFFWGGDDFFVYIFCDKNGSLLFKKGDNETRELKKNIPRVHIFAQKNHLNILNKG